MRRLLLVPLLYALCAASDTPPDPATSSSSLSASPPAEPSTSPQHDEEIANKVQEVQEILESSATVTAEATALSVMSEAEQPTSSTSTSSASCSFSTSSETPHETSTATTEPSSIPATTAAPSSDSSSASPTSLPSSSDITSPSSPAVEQPSPSPLPSPAAPDIEELPLTQLPTVPELLSFNEWKERYVVPEVAAGRRSKRATRVRHEGAGGTAEAEKTDAGGSAVEVEKVLSFEEAVEARRGAARAVVDAVEVEEAVTAIPSSRAVTSDLSSPIQPLPNVGTGGPIDPLTHLKDRSNYADVNCNAMVHRLSRGSKGASAILSEKKDRYMLTPCSAEPKFVDVELCNEIQIDTLVLANFEFFSSTFKHFKASCSVDYPGTSADWHDLGTYRARNVRGIQVFRPRNNPFCRYLRIDFLSHFGSEYYCPVSLLRVYGYTQIDAYRESERKAKAMAEALEAAELIMEEQEEQERELDDMLRVEVERLESVDTARKVLNGTEKTGEQEVSKVAPSPVPSAALNETTTSTSTSLSTSSALPFSSISSVTTSFTTLAESPIYLSPATSTSVASSSETTHFASSLSFPAPSTNLSASTSLSNASITSSSSVANSPTGPSRPETSSSAPSTNFSSSASPSPPSPFSSPSSSSSISTRPPSSAYTPSSSFSTSSTHFRTAPSETPSVATRPLPRNDSHYPPPPPPARPPIHPPPIHHQQQPQPGESIYGTIMKRLSMLEMNQTLSMHFIEAQSSMLREAFGRVEKRLGEIEGSRTRQEQSIRQALLDLERQRGELDRDRLELAAQVGLLAEEVRFEKRLTFAQLIALVLVALFVGFTRSIPTSPFLHLASGQPQRPVPPRKESKQRKEVEQERRVVRDKEVEEQRRVEGDLSGSDATRRSHRHAASISSHRQANPSKRYPSLSKSGPRRHYGVGTSSSSSKLLSAIRRPFSPPVRHSSAPPEEPFPSSAAFEAKEAARNRIFPPGGSRRGSPYNYEFPSRSAGRLDKTAGLAIDTSPDSVAASAHQFLTLPPSRSSRSGLSSSAAEEADTEPSDSPFPSLDIDEADDERFVHASGVPSPYSSSSQGTFDGGLGVNGGGDDHDLGYHTYSSAGEDEHSFDSSVSPLPPPVKTAPPLSLRYTGGRKGSAASQGGGGSRSGRNGGGGGGTLRPPKPQVRVRPATSMGIPSPVMNGKGKEREVDEEDNARGEKLSVPEPSSTLPSPPPEQKKTLEVQQQQQQRDGNEKSVPSL
ncbi:hypothetical protein JCM8547_000288 [Rhodosporidiobolus lusitaniae]